jgi:Concanavalin A-like lectin/glucanases superfamily
MTSNIKCVCAAILGGLFTAGTLQAELVAYWPLNDGASGTAVTNANELVKAGLTFQNATLQGAAKGTGTWSNDVTRGIVYSTKENENLLLGTQGINLTNGFTWSLWVKVAATNLTDLGADLIIGSRSGVWNAIWITSFDRWATIGGFNLADDTWHHLAVVGTSEPRVTLYIDGASVGSVTTLRSNQWVVNDTFQLGGYNADSVTGLLSALGVWNEPLSEARIRELAAGAPPYVAPGSMYFQK